MAQEVDLREYYKFGFSLLQWALIIGVLGLFIVGVYEYLY